MKTKVAFLTLLLVCAAIGWAAWAVLGVSVSVYAMLVAHRAVQRVGAARAFRLLAAHCWGWAYALEEHQAYVAKTKTEIATLDSKHRGRMESIA